MRHGAGICSSRAKLLREQLEIPGLQQPWEPIWRGYGPQIPRGSLSHRAGMGLGCCAGTSPACPEPGTRHAVCVTLQGSSSQTGLKGSSAHLPSRYDYPHLSSAHLRGVLYLKHNKGDLHVHKHLNFVAVPNGGEMKTKHLSDLENKLRTEILMPSQAYTTAHLLSCYLQRHLQPQPWLSLVLSVLFTSNWVQHDENSRSTMVPKEKLHHH